MRGFAFMLRKRSCIFAGVLFLTSSFSMGSAGAASQEEEIARIATEVSNSLLAIEDGLLESSRDRWDPQFVVDKVGTNADALFRWVKQEIRWVPYRGALRGPVGVLMDRRANSLDQALLLADLLGKAGFTTRLARAELTDTLADTLIAEATANPGISFPILTAADASATQAAPVPEVPELEAIAADYDLDRSGAENLLSRAASEAASVAAQLAQRSTQQSHQLAALVGLGNAANSGEEMARSRASMKDHWWVEVDEGAGWVALDPLAPGGQRGATVASPASTLNVSDLPRELRYPLVLRVVAERLKEALLQEQNVFEMAMVPSEMIGKTFAMSFYPMAWPGNWPSVTPDDIQTRLRAAVFTQHEWMPLLTLGRDQYAQSSIRDNGELQYTPNPGNPYAEIGIPAAGLFVKAGDLLSTGEADDAGDAKKAAESSLNPEGELTAVWLEFEITEPDGNRRKFRRQVFDLLGPVRRASGNYEGYGLTDDDRLSRSMAMLSEARILIAPSALSPDYLLHQTGRAILANKNLFEDLAGDPFGKAPANTADIVAKFDPLPGALEATAALRFEGSPMRESVFVDRPQILAEHGTLRRDAKTGDFSINYALDFIDNHVGIIDPTTDPTLIRLVQGVADTNAEALALRGKPSLLNTADLFQESLDKGDAWLVLRPVDEAKVTALPLSEDEMALLANTLRSGSVVVLPKQFQTDRLVWWRIDPVNGATLGIGPRGQGVSMVEYALVLIAKQLLAQAACVLSRGIVEAGTAAIESGKPEAGLPKNWEEAKVTGKRLAKSCIAQAMLFQLTGIVNLYFTSFSAFALNPYRGPIGTDPYAQTQAGANPFAKTQPGANPFAKTQPGANPFAKTQPGTSPYANTQPGTSPYANTQPGTSPYANTQPGTSPQPGNSPLAKSQPGTSPLAKSQPGTSPQSGSSPLAKTQGAAPGQAEIPPGLKNAIERENQAYDNYMAMLNAGKANNPNLPADKVREILAQQDPRFREAESQMDAAIRESFRQWSVAGGTQQQKDYLKENSRYRGPDNPPPSAPADPGQQKILTGMGSFGASMSSLP